MTKLHSVYEGLFSLYGPQGWWPLGKGSRYHPGDYSLPQRPAGVFEVYLGAVLTQNNSWTGAAAALEALRQCSAVCAPGLLALPVGELEEAIRPARYWRQKARYIRGLASFFIDLKGRVPSREELLAVVGVGRETADSIRLYAHHQPAFVVDAYTRRVFSALGVISGGEDHDVIQRLFEKALPNDYTLFNEYHALIVRHARAYYSKKPYGIGDPLLGAEKKRKRVKT
jgi:endonuclease-3 related protein